VVRLLEAHLTLRIRIMTEDVRDLFQDQNQANRCQQALDDTQREEGRDEAQSQRAHHHLHHTRHNHRRQKRLETAQCRDLRRHDGREAGRRPAHTLVRAAQHAYQQPAHDPGDQTGEQRRIGGQRDSEA
jgi:hypothetical protein